jgi:hypothetical protein
MTHLEGMNIGVKITMDDPNVVNLRLHSLLYGLFVPFVETIEATTPAQGSVYLCLLMLEVNSYV